MDKILDILDQIDAVVWGMPLILLLMGTGCWLTILLRGIQFRVLGHALHLAFIKRGEKTTHGDISHFQALMTALSATVGVGNIAGVATAIATGGPGALFWMWMTGLVGMATKYAEALLAVKYRVVGPDGTMNGGPMYYLSRGLGQKWLAILFSVFTVLASFGIGNMTQSNTVADVLTGVDVPAWLTGLVLTILTAAVVLGGIKTIARVASILVPVMVLFYMAAGLLILAMRITEIPHALRLIFLHAFSPLAAVGGFTGAVVRETVRMGVARGLFSNESGLGSAPIAAAAARTNHPVAQALVSMTQTFIDTIVVCSVTGLTIVTTGAWTSGQTGAALTISAFESALGWMGRVTVACSLALFAYSTLIGWNYYGEKAMSYLVGGRGILPYRVMFIMLVFVGAVTKLETVWTLADIFNGLMALPNLVGLIGLSPMIIEETHHYLRNVRLGRIER